MPNQLIDNGFSTSFSKSAHTAHLHIRSLMKNIQMLTAQPTLQKLLIHESLFSNNLQQSTLISSYNTFSLFFHVALTLRKVLKLG